MKRLLYLLLFCASIEAVNAADGLYFDGEDDRVEIPWNSGYSIGTDEFTLEAIINMPTNPNQTTLWTVFDSHNGTQGGVGLSIDDIGNDQQNIIVKLGTENYTYNSLGIDLTDNQYHHIAITRAQTSLELYIDGVLIETKTSGADVTTNYGIRIGLSQSNTVNKHFEGSIQEVRFWRINRTQSEINEFKSKYLGDHGSDLIGYWKMAGHTGQEVYDYSYKSNHGVRGSSSAVQVSDPSIVEVMDLEPASLNQNIAGSLSFDGVDDEITVPYNSAYDFGAGDFTFEAWIKPKSFDNRRQTILSSRTMHDNGYFFGVFVEVSGRAVPFIQLQGVSYIDYYNELSELKINVWQHVVFTRSNNELSLYVNGTKTYTVTSIKSANTPAGLHFGNDQPDNTTDVLFDGIMSELRMWNDTRTNYEIESMSDQRLTGSESNLVGYWPLTDCEGQTVTDYSSTANSGVLGTNSSVESKDPSCTEDCATPVLYNATNITETSTDLSWSATSAVGTYKLRYSKVITGEPLDWQYVDDIAGETYSLLGIALGTDYRWQVKAYCDEGILATGNYDNNSTFTTLGNPVCDAPYAFVDNSLTSNNVDMSWSGNANTYTVKYKKTQTSVWTTISGLTSPNVQILNQNLIPGEYRVDLRSFCSTNNSDWVTRFVTISSGAKTGTWTDVNSDVFIYPNPSTTSFNIVLPEGAKRLQIADMTGSVIETLALTTDGEIVVGNKLSPGLYLVLISVNDRLVIKKLIKE